MNFEHFCTLPFLLVQYGSALARSAPVRSKISRGQGTEARTGGRAKARPRRLWSDAGEGTAARIGGHAKHARNVPGNRCPKGPAERRVGARGAATAPRSAAVGGTTARTGGRAERARKETGNSGPRGAEAKVDGRAYCARKQTRSIAVAAWIGGRAKRPPPAMLLHSGHTASL